MFANSEGSKKSSGEGLFVQKLEWESRGIVKEYRIIIEELKDGNYVEVLNDTTKENSYSVSLKPGQYRYKVIFYNVLGQPAFTTSSIEFEIRTATQPVIFWKPFDYVYLDEQETRNGVAIDGKEIYSSSEITLLLEDGTEVKPASVEIDEMGVFVGFPKKLLDENGSVIPGDYKVKVQNPGGLTAVSTLIHVREHRQLYTELCVGWNPGLYVYDDFIYDYFGTRWQNSESFFNGRFLFELNETNRLGAELVYCSGGMTKVYSKGTVSTLTVNWLLNLVYSRPFCIESLNGLKINLNAFAGAGTANLLRFSAVKNNGYSLGSFDSTLPCIDAGVDATIFVYEKLFVRTGASFNASLNFGRSDYNLGRLNGFIGLGVQL